MNKDSGIPKDPDMTIEIAASQGGYYDTNDIWNSIVQVGEKIYRSRVEALVLKLGETNEIFMHKFDGGYRVPGGSLDKGVSMRDQAIAETEEEARIVCSEMMYSGVTYYEETDTSDEEKAKLKEEGKLLWDGKCTEVFIGSYLKPFEGAVHRDNIDKDMYSKGKFYPIRDVFDELTDPHKEAIHNAFDEEGLAEEDSINESLIFNKKDIEINTDKFYEGKYNVLLVTGLSGSGKSTLAAELARKYNAKIIELDMFSMFYDMEDGYIEKNEPWILEYMNKHPSVREKIVNGIGDKDYDEEIKKYMKWVFSYAKKDKKNKYIIEGIQIYGQLTKDDIGGLPIIINGVSLSTSQIRKIKRNGDGKFLESLKKVAPSDLLESLKWYYGQEKMLSKFKKSLNEFNDIRNADNPSLACITADDKDWFHGWEKEEEGTISKDMKTEAAEAYFMTYDYRTLRKISETAIEDDGSETEGYMDPSEDIKVPSDWFATVERLCQKYNNTRDMVTKKEILRLGWNPEIPFNLDSVVRIIRRQTGEKVTIPQQEQ